MGGRNNGDEVMNGWELWLLCGALTIVLMWLYDLKQRRSLTFTQQKFTGSTITEIGIVVMIFVLGPIALAFTLLSFFDD